MSKKKYKLVIRTGLMSCALVISGLVNAEARAEGPDLRDYQKVRELSSRSLSAYRKGDYTRAMGFLRRGLEAFPNYPTLVFNMAALGGIANDTEVAFEYLDRLLALRVYRDLEAESDFDPIRDNPDFQRRWLAIQQLLEHRGSAQEAFSIAPEYGLIEGISFDPAEERFLLGSITERSIYERRPDGVISTYYAGGLWSDWGFRSFVLSGEGELWATSVGLQQAKNTRLAHVGASALLQFNLSDGEVLDRRIFLPIEGMFEFDAIAADGLGNIYVANTGNRSIERLSRRNGGRLETLAEQKFRIIQGLALKKDGKVLIASDQVLGLARIDLPFGRVRRLEPPADVVLTGIDGIYPYGDSIIAIQNGLLPNKILRIRLSADWKQIEAVEELDAGHAAYGVPTHGVIVGDSFYYIANSQWRKYDDSGEQLEPLTSTIVLRIDLAN